MRVDFVTLFPEMFEGFLATSFVGRAQQGGQLSVRLRSPRDFGLGKHRSVDDTPYGGGSGMVMRVDVIVATMESLLPNMMVSTSQPAMKATATLKPSTNTCDAREGCSYLRLVLAMPTPKIPT